MMIKIRKFDISNLLINILSLIIPSHLLAQNFTNSPYSVYGIGVIESKGFSRNSGMGSTGIAMPSGKGLNPLNPASYAALDSMDFLLDMGIFGKISDFESQGDKQMGLGVNFKYLAMGFKASKNWGISVGLKPYCSRGYMILADYQVEGGLDSYKSLIIGSGSVNQVYFSNSVKILPGLSIGLNSSYLFGSLIQDETIIYPAIGQNQTSVSKTNYFNNFLFDYGIQYQFRKGDYDFYSGLTFAHKQYLNSRYERKVSLNSNLLDTRSEGNDNFTIPPNIGFGIGFGYKNKYKVFSDFTFEQWSQSKYQYLSSELIDSRLFNIGMEYSPTHNFLSRYRKRITYRAGFWSNNSYLQLRQNQINESAFSLGLELPCRNRNTINLAFEYGHQGTTSDRLIQEKYLRITFGISLHEQWFQKRMYD